MRIIECVDSGKFNPDHMQKMLDDGWKIVDCYHMNGLVTTIYEKKVRA